jgi:hypothetical protein
MAQKYINVPTYMPDHYWTVEQLQELQAFFESKLLLWCSGLEKPNIAERMAHAAFAGACRHAKTQDKEDRT